MKRYAENYPQMTNPIRSILMNDSDGSYCCQTKAQESAQSENDDPDLKRMCFVACDVNGGLPIRV